MKKMLFLLILILFSTGAVSHSAPIKKVIIKKKATITKKAIIKKKPIIIKQKTEEGKVEIKKPATESPKTQKIPEPEKPLVVVLPEIKKRPYLLLEAGYFGGGAGIKAGYILPKDFYQLEPHLNIGYGFGQGYGVSLIQAELANYDGPYSFGISYDIATYSTRVLDLPGLPNIIEKGSRASLGGFFGKELFGVEIKLGYSSAQGFIITAAGRRS